MLSSHSIPRLGGVGGAVPCFRSIRLALSAFVMTLATVPSGHAAFTPISQPGDTIPGASVVYSSATRLLPSATGSSISDSGLKVTFGCAMSLLYVPESTWGATPNTEGGTAISLRPNAVGFTMALSHPATVFGFEAMTNYPGTFTVTADFYSGTTLLGTITRNAAFKREQARLFAAAMTDDNDAGIDRVVVTTSDTNSNTPVIARVRYLTKSCEFSTQPAGSSAGIAFGTQPAVTFYDEYGSVSTAFTGPVTVAIKPGTGATGAVLNGTTTVNAVAGVATFTDLSIDKPGTGYALTATGGAFVPADSTAFNITPYQFTLADAFDSLRWAAGLSVMPSGNLERYDIVPNGMVDLSDAARIFRKAAGLDSNQ